MTKTQKKTGLALLREPFEDRQIGKLPKPTKAQTQKVKNDFKSGIRCKVCGAWHHPDVVHLDYVGHAALTDRLLDADPHWYWEPVAFTALGLPAFDETGGLWIRLFIHDGDKLVNRLGYGHAADSSFKEIGSREKEVIGDALRNAGMRFGAALDLWHKGDLHHDEGDDDQGQGQTKTTAKKDWNGPLNEKVLRKQIDAVCDLINGCTKDGSLTRIKQIMIDNQDAIKQARLDDSKLIASVKEASKMAKQRIIDANGFPGDATEDNPFGLPQENQ